MPAPPRRYGLLLVILVVTYLLSAFFSSRWINDLQLTLFTIAGLLEIRNSRIRKRYARVLAASGFVVSLLMIVVANHHGGLAGRGVASIWTALLLVVIVVMILRQILAAQTVTLQSIYGAISTYMIIGLMFAAIYAAISHFLHDQNFFANHQRGRCVVNFQYFSFTTLTTLGYGDFTAIRTSAAVRSPMLEAMTPARSLPGDAGRQARRHVPPGRPGGEIARSPASVTGRALHALPGLWAQRCDQVGKRVPVTQLAAVRQVADHRGDRELEKRILGRL